MKLTALSIALVAALGMTAGCSTQSSKQSAAGWSVVADAEAQYALGRFYQGQQRYDLAIEAYRKALGVNPSHVSAHNGLGASLLLAGQHEAAIEQFKTGLKYQPRSAALWNNLGYAYTLGGENRLAEIALKQALDLDPTDIKTNTNMAMAREGASQPAPLASAPATVASSPPDAAQREATPIAAPGASAAVNVAANVGTNAGTTQTAPVAAVVVADVQATASPAQAAAQPAEPAMKLQPSTVLASAPAPAPAAIQVVETVPRVYELSLPDTTVTVAATAAANPLVKTSEFTRISVPLRNETVAIATAPEIAASLGKAQAVALNNEDFVLEIRNGNGVRRMAWRTSQYLAHQGYTTKRLTNQRGFNVATTRIFYLPGYLAEAERLLAHLPGNTTLTESLDLRSGTHVRVVLGKDMVQHQASLDAAPAPIHLAALTR